MLCGDASWLESTFGDEVQGSDGKNVSTKSIAKNFEFVSLYFSAHWCPPCRGFTPNLVKAYNAVNKDAKRWEIIFVSSDKGDSQFNEYFGEMPWTALPYAKRELKAKLSKKFKVNGIPTLIHLDPKTGDILNLEGRSSVMGDLEGTNFPWINKPKSFWDIMGGLTITKKDTSFPATDLKNKDYIAIYFSAHWCPPCRGFTPNLNKWYSEYYKEDGNFEMIFNSWDRDEASFNDYYKDMPFATRQWKDKEAKEGLDKLFSVNGIPSLIVVDAKTGKVVTQNGRAGVMAKPDQFPWEKKPLAPLGNESTTAINEGVCVFAHCGFAEGEAAMKEIATEYANKAKASEEWPDMELEFIVDDGSHPLSKRIKEVSSREDTDLLYVFSLSERAIFVHKEVKAVSDITDKSVRELVEAYKGDRSKLTKKALSL